MIFDGFLFFFCPRIGRLHIVKRVAQWGSELSVEIMEKAFSKKGAAAPEKETPKTLHNKGNVFFNGQPTRKVQSNNHPQPLIYQHPFEDN